MILKLKMTVVVETLNIKLYKLFVKQLMELNIGYNYNPENISKMLDIINAIDYLTHKDLDKQTIQKILNLYA